MVAQELVEQLFPITSTLCLPPHLGNDADLRHSLGAILNLINALCNFKLRIAHVQCWQLHGMPIPSL